MRCDATLVRGPSGLPKTTPCIGLYGADARADCYLTRSVQLNVVMEWSDHKERRLIRNSLR